MTANFRHLETGETDAELLVIAASAGSLIYAGAWLATGLPAPRCAFHAITGCPCPTCGATRCVMALLHGHVAQAIGWNPLAFIGLVLLAVLNIYSGVALAARLPRFRFSIGASEGRILRVAFVILVTANWAYEIHRGV